MKKQPEEETEGGELVVVPDKATASVEIVPFGTTDRIRLSAAIVRQMIAQPTRTGKLPDDNQCIKFIMLCKARHLNPFEGDAFMLGYDTQNGPQFSLITAHQVFLKRAEASKGFNGMESGVIVQGKNDTVAIIEREGDLVMDDEKLIGGWAKVYRKDREKPFYRRLKLSVFNTGRSRWEKDPAGMICKCAEADALRTAFPTHLGGLYIEEEPQAIDVATETTILRPKIEDVKPVKDSSGGAESSKPETDAPSKKAPAAAPKKFKKPEVKLVETNAANVIRRLQDLGKTKADFERVALYFKVLDPGQGWDNITEAQFADCLDADNWKLIEEQLTK